LEVPTREKVGKDRLPGFREFCESELWISDFSISLQYLTSLHHFHCMNQRDRKGDSGLSGLATLPFSWNLQPNFVGLGEGRDHCCCVHARFLGGDNEMKMLFIKPYSKMYLSFIFKIKKQNCCLLP
jgi:hypothetical protein